MVMLHRYLIYALDSASKIEAVFISEWETPTWPPSIQIGVTAGIFFSSILLKEMRYLVYIRYLCYVDQQI